MAHRDMNHNFLRATSPTKMAIHKWINQSYEGSPVTGFFKTHLPRDEMVAILADDIFKRIS